jgi:hypothetical protein
VVPLLCTFLVIKEAVSDPYYVIKQNIVTAFAYLKRSRDVK